MTGQRKRYSADFKAKVVLDAIRGELTMAQLVSQYGVRQTMISAWRKQAIEGMAGDVLGSRSFGADSKKPLIPFEDQRLKHWMRGQDLNL
ncbi:transposase [Niveispirillum sp. SYP-B3756]|nr:transposase [Niveispirillum sp. SYP-B3756]